MRSRDSTFRRRVAIAMTLLVAASLSVAAIGIWGVIRIHDDSSVALQGYRQLREVYEVGVYVEQARQSLQQNPADKISAIKGADQALSRFDIFAMTPDDWVVESKPIAEKLRYDLSQATNATNSNGCADALDNTLADLATLASQVRLTVQTHQLAADHERRLSIILISSLSGALVMLAILVGILHYRSVVHPVDRLATAVREFASGYLDRRVTPGGGREFSQLAQDLNHMADELQTLYLQLEEKVAEKSRELVRSERLASVGYLAAGVAHEINNPLGIIAAYAERALQRMRRGSLNAESTENMQQAFTIICEEAFRCKEITERLLMMARPAPAMRSPVSVAALAQEVISTIADLPQFRHASIVLQCDEQASPILANVNASEIKQVILNLLVNAVEAIDDRGDDRGRVSVVVQNGRDGVEVVVQDDGKGMENETLHRVFEPFFSEKRHERHGTGLGLTICHSIAAAHGGALLAASDGVGQGSRFTLRLPRAKIEAQHA